MAIFKPKALIVQFLPLISVAAFCACGGKTAGQTESVPSIDETSRSTLWFSADSAFNNIAEQLEFGPRVPGTASHDSCANWIAEKAAMLMDTVILQKGKVTAFNGDVLPITNIFGQINVNSNDRILLLAHYDTRPWADAETDKSRVNIPIPGANDGASGVAVMLELARVIKEKRPAVGVDFLFVDAEDYGTPQHLDSTGLNEDTWCLGTQYWVENRGGYTPQFAILLDMVGGEGALFHREYFSDRYSKPVNDLVWNVARKEGFGSYFIDELGNPITDDHLYLLKAGIPSIDIIENKNSQTGSFNPTWHTHNDNLEHIDRETLNAVGTTVLGVINNL